MEKIEGIGSINVSFSSRLYNSNVKWEYFQNLTMSGDPGYREIDGSVMEGGGQIIRITGCFLEFCVLIYIVKEWKYDRKIRRKCYLALATCPVIAVSRWIRYSRTVGA